MRLTALDLFAGMGGLTRGLRDAEFSVLGAVERSELAVETYKANHRRTRVWNCDIRKLDPASVATELGLAPGDLDLLAGCPPCQGFSSLTTRNGHRAVEDERNELVFQFGRFAEELRPKALMMENVPGLASDDRFKRLEANLRKMGYSLLSLILDVADYGVPQRRRRLLLLGGMGWRPELGRRVRQRPTVRAAIGELPESGESGDPLHDLPEHRSRRIIDLIRQIPADGGSRASLGSDVQLACHQEFDGFRDVYGRIAWDGLAPTITGGCVNPSKGRFLHPEQHRAISLREAALLQGFPPKYKVSLRRGKYQAAELIGNALPPPFARRHARALSRCIRTREST